MQRVVDAEGITAAGEALEVFAAVALALERIAEVGVVRHDDEDVAAVKLAPERDDSAGAGADFRVQLLQQSIEPLVSGPLARTPVLHKSRFEIFQTHPDALTVDEKNQLSALSTVVSRIFTSWNHLDGWLRQIEGLRRVA